MNNLEVVIGIEIHIELNTKTKMFSAAPNNFGAPENTNVNEVDMAYPGTLPQLNKGAVVRAIKLAKALNMKIDNVLHFDRKNYFYPDLPKGYQITQQARPIGSGGFVPIEVNGERVEVTMERIHLEEDTAKAFHRGTNTLLNYNRAGVPLIEIVSNPVMRSGAEAAAYVDTIRSLALSLGISDAKMEEGSLRADVNISLKPRGSKKLGTKVEIKNMNSISNIQKAIESEIKSQTKDILTGVEIRQATKRFDEATNKPVVMRYKGNAVDYKFFPEPNIPLIRLPQEFIDSITNGELPWEKKERLNKLGLSKDQVHQLLSDKDKSDFFDDLKYGDKVKAAKVFFAEVVSLANSKQASISDLNIDAKEFDVVLNKLETGDISGKHVKQLVPLLSSTNKSALELIEEKGMKQISDETTINSMISVVLEKNAAFVEANKDRPDRVIKFLNGQVMKESKGQVNPAVSGKLVAKAVNGVQAKA